MQCSIGMEKKGWNMTGNEWSDIENIVKGLVGDLKEALTWSWEDRFQATLAEFPASDKDRVLRLLEPRFDSLWDAASISEAPPRIYEICQKYGGLRSGQLLLATDPGKDILILGAWWPWGNQKTISLRVIPVDSDTPAPDFDEFIGLFKGWFGL
jgi:hypothetical protein